MNEFTFKGKNYTYMIDDYGFLRIFANVISLVTDADVHTAAKKHQAERLQAIQDFHDGRRVSDD